MSLIGKYEGYVVSTKSDLDTPNKAKKRGRILCTIPRVFGTEEIWCEPCYPPGIIFVPHVGDKVYIEFPQESPDHPIWVGWSPQEDLPEPAAEADAHIRLIDTKAGQIQFCEKEGSEYIKFKDIEGNLIHFDIPNKDIICDFKNNLSIAVAKDAEITVGNDAKVDVSNNVDIKAGSNITIDANDKVSIKSGADTKIEASGNVEVKGTLIKLNGSASGVTTMNSHQGVVDFITGVPVSPSTTVMSDI